MSKWTDTTLDPRIYLAGVLLGFISLEIREEPTPNSTPGPSRVSQVEGGAQRSKRRSSSWWENVPFIDLEAVLDSWHFHIWPAGRRPCLAARRPMIFSEFVKMHNMKVVGLSVLVLTHFESCRSDIVWESYGQNSGQCANPTFWGGQLGRRWTPSAARRGSCEAVGGVKEAQIKSLFLSKSSTRAPGSNKAPECSKYLKCQSKHSSNQKPRGIHLNAQVKGDFRYEMSMKRAKYMHMNATHQIPQAWTFACPQATN